MNLQAILGKQYPDDLAERIVAARVIEALPVWHNGGQIGIPFRGWNELGSTCQYPLIYFYVEGEDEIPPPYARALHLFRVLAIRKLTQLWKDDPIISKVYKPVPWEEEWTEERPAIPASVKRAVYTRDGRVCARCGSTENPTLDHIHPWSRGGKHTVENLQVLCRSCNSSKGAKLG